MNDSFGILSCSKDICNDVRIVDFGCCVLVLLYKFGLLVCFDMTFITIVFLATFLCPTRIYVLVSLLVPFALLLSVIVTIFGIPKVVAVAFLDLLVLLLCVALAWRLDKRGIDYLALVERQSFVVKFCMELVEQEVESTCLAEPVSAEPDGLLIRYFCNCLNSEKLAEVGTVNYLILYLVVPQTIITLQKYDFKQQYNIDGLTACRGLTLLGQQHLLQYGAEHFEVNELLQNLQRIAHSGQSLYREFLLEEVFVHWRAICRDFLHIFVLFYCKGIRILQICKKMLVISRLIFITSLIFNQKQIPSSFILIINR